MEQTMKLIKQLIKRFLLQLSKQRYFNRKSKVIFYHDIHQDDKSPYTDMSTPLSLFEAHITTMRQEGFEIVSRITEPQNQIMITFDDGFKGLHDNLYFLERMNVPITLFVIADFIDNDPYLTKEELDTLLQSKLITIGSHTCSHQNLDELSTSEIQHEISASKTQLEALLNIEVQSFCYPRGRFNDSVLNEAKKHYGEQYSCLPGNYFEPYSEGVIKRNFVQHVTPKELKAYLYGAGEGLYERYYRQHYRPSSS